MGMFDFLREIVRLPATAFGSGMEAMAATLQDVQRASGQRLDSMVSRAVQTMSPGPAPRGLEGGGQPPLPGAPSAALPPQAPGAMRAGWGGATTATPVPPAGRGRMKPGPIVVLGESLAAGVSNFSLSAELQCDCFPALLARQTGTPFAQPCFQPPGIGIVGFSPLPLLVPGLMQSTVYHPGLPTAPFSNLAVPGFTIADALRLRPAAPVIRQGDAKQTAANLILGAPAFLTGGDVRPTQLEAACRQKPALAIVALGFHEVMEPAALCDAGRLPSVSSACADLGRIIGTLRESGADVLVLTVPDPFDTAFFSPVATAARLLRVPSSYLAQWYRLRPGDLITLYGLIEIANQLLAGAPAALDRGCVLRAETAAEIRGRVQDLNARLVPLAQQRGAVVHDLNGLIKRLASTPAVVGSRRLSADYLGGIYSLNGVTPGQVGHGLIANELLDALNRTYGASFPPVDLASLLITDFAANYQAAQGPETAPPPLPGTRAPARPSPTAVAGRTRDEDRRPVGRRVEPDGPSLGGIGPPLPPAWLPLRLPDGLEQVLPLNPALSHHGDGIRAESAGPGKGLQFGGSGNLLFGGVLLFGSHLRGSIRIRFSPPVSDVTRFELDFLEGLAGDDGVLSAPVYFRLPVLQSRVVLWPGTVASGLLNLATGEVSQLDFKVVYLNSALDILRKANPAWPAAPIGFPGAYGTASAQFEPRADGKLDFTFAGSTFIPLSTLFQPVRFALPIGGGSPMPASVPADGTALHPQLHLSTKSPGRPAAEAQGVGLKLPVNAVQELTLCTHNSSFGDGFELNLPEFGGEARGRSQLLGRLQVQFGEPSGGSVPFAVSGLPPGGQFIVPEETPIADNFPGRLPCGLLGHDEFLRFPRRTYFLDAVELIDDPFDIALGSVDLATGEVIGGQIHRGFIAQNLIFALLRVEPRTPKSSFLFRGPAMFEQDPGGTLIYRFNGYVVIPYPDGFAFPATDLASGYRVGLASRLVPYFRLQGMTPSATAGDVTQGGGEKVLASNGNVFSFRYIVPFGDAREGQFEYVNHTQGGRFRMHTLFCKAFTRTRGRQPAGGPADIVTFAGRGTWCFGTAESPAFVAVQVSVAPRQSYISIQVGGGLISNVNTKPPDEASTLP